MSESAEVHDPKGQVDRSKLPADVQYADELTSKRLAKTLRAAARYNLERRGFEVSYVEKHEPWEHYYSRDKSHFTVKAADGSVSRFLVTVELME